jgi:predicted phosphodiesterase
MASQSSEDRKDFLIGIISDTHGRLNQAALNIFKGVDIIIHPNFIGELLNRTVL